MNTLFEKIAADINWSKGTNVAAEKLKLMREYPSDVIDEVRSYAVDLVNKLYEVVASYEEEHGSMGIWSDDSYSDLLYHIVSQGEEYVNEVIANPKLVGERFEKRDFYESFSYVFPHEDDYEMMELSYYEKSADRILEALEQVDDMEPMDEMDIRDVCDEFRRGFFNTAHTYNVLWELGRKIHVEALIANIWNDGQKFFTQKS